MMLCCVKRPADSEEYPILAVRCDVHMHARYGRGARRSAKYNHDSALFYRKTSQAAVVAAINCLLRLALGQLQQCKG